MMKELMLKTFFFPPRFDLQANKTTNKLATNWAMLAPLAAI
jgi:hypothetical protein